MNTTERQLVKEMERALRAWMVYAESNYSGDGIDAVTLTKAVLAKMDLHWMMQANTR